MPKLFEGKPAGSVIRVWIPGCSTGEEASRAGVYPSSIVADVSAERLAKYFTQTSPDDSTYRINKAVRDMVVFAEHDLIRNPPLSKLDLLSCRNLLIYMSTELRHSGAGVVGERGRCHQSVQSAQSYGEDL